MAIFYFARRARKLRYYAMLYTHSIGNPRQNTMVVFIMRDSVPSARYSPICNVLRQWKTSLIPIYRVYRLYDIKNEKTFKNEQRNRDDAQKRANTSGVGESNNYL